MLHGLMGGLGGSAAARHHSCFPGDLCAQGVAPKSKAQEAKALVASGAGTCATKFVDFDSVHLVHENHVLVVDLFNDASKDGDVTFMPNTCGNPPPQDRTRHHSTCSAGPFGDPTYEVIDGEHVIDFEGQVQAPAAGCVEAYSCVAGMLTTSPVAVSCGSPYIEYQFKAVGGNDWYEAVVALYMINGSSPMDQWLVDTHVYRGSEMSEYIVERFTAIEQGNYFVRFFAASYDRDGGETLGAKLTVKQVTGTFNKIVLHGDPMFKLPNGNGVHFRLSPGQLTPLLNWVAADGTQMSLLGESFAEADKGRQIKAGNEWFNKVLLTANGEPVINATAGSSQFGTLHVAVDKKQLLLAPNVGAVHTVKSTTCSSVQLQVSKLESKLKRNAGKFMIGDKHAEKIAIKAGDLDIEIWSGKAAKFVTNRRKQARFMHLNMRVMGAMPHGATGPLAELSGASPLSAETEALVIRQ